MHVEYFTVAEAKRILHAPKIEHTARTVLAAHSLMQACEHDADVTFEDMLRCLDYGGTIAEIGARCLYVRTGRDNLRWRYAGDNGLPFIVDRSNWEAYLREHFRGRTC